MSLKNILRPGLKPCTSQFPSTRFALENSAQAYKAPEISVKMADNANTLHLRQNQNGCNYWLVGIFMWASSFCFCYPQTAIETTYTLIPHRNALWVIVRSWNQNSRGLSYYVRNSTHSARASLHMLPDMYFCLFSDRIFSGSLFENIYMYTIVTW